MTADHACDAKLVIVDEAPGRREDEQGIPFVGAAGALLERWWEPLGLHRADFAIYNVYPYRPPANKIQAIPRDAIEFWSERLRERIAALADPVVSGLGVVLTMHLGPDDVLLNLEVQFTEGLPAEEIHAAVHRIEERINDPYPEVSRIFIEVEALRGGPAGATRVG